MHHRWHIAPEQYERHEARRGRRHAFEHLDPRTTVLVVVDMVPFFVDENPYTRGIVPNVNRLAAGLRAAGGTVAWTVPATGRPTPVDVERLGPVVATAYAASGGDGSPAERLSPLLDRHDADLVAEKSASSAFFPGRSTLPGLLADRPIETVVVAGTVANVCCESTARDASTLGYRTIMVADACSTVSDEMLNATLTTVYRSFGDVRTTEEVLELIDSDL